MVQHTGHTTHSPSHSQRSSLLLFFWTRGPGDQGTRRATQENHENRNTPKGGLVPTERAAPTKPNSAAPKRRTETQEGNTTPTNAPHRHHKPTYATQKTAGMERTLNLASRGRDVPVAAPSPSRLQTTLVYGLSAWSTISTRSEPD